MKHPHAAHPHLPTDLVGDMTRQRKLLTSGDVPGSAAGARGGFEMYGDAPSGSCKLSCVVYSALCATRRQLLATSSGQWRDLDELLAGAT